MATFTVRVRDEVLERLDRCVAESPHFGNRNSVLVYLVCWWCERAEKAREVEGAGS